MGFSSDGLMFPGDAVVGYVSDDGKGHIQDYLTVGHRPPVEDSQQDNTLLASRQVHTGTMLKFSRSLDTGDQQDRALHAGRTYVIWAYSDADPTPAGMMYHGSTRGSKQIELISADVPVGK